MSTAAQRAADEHIKSVWEMVRVGRDAAIVHKGGDAERCLPRWDTLDEPSKIAFIALAISPLRQLMMIADAIVAELDGGRR